MRINSTALLGALFLFGEASGARASTSYFTGMDPGAGVGQSRPQSDAARSNYDSACSALGGSESIDFESLPTGPYTGPFNVHPDVTLVLTTNAPLGSGVSTDPSQSSSVYLGYNTTLGGAKYVRVDTNSSQQTPYVALEFQFQHPVVAWGAYLTGLGNTPGSGQVSLVLETDRTNIPPDSIPNPYPTGGVLFVGLTSPGNPFRRITVRLSDPSQFINANIGVDDVRFTTAAPDADGDGYRPEDNDCNDQDPTVNPDATESCDGYDNDCNSAIDDNAGCDGSCDNPDRAGPIQRLSQASPPQWLSNMGLAWTGSRFAAVWDETHNGRQQIYLRFLAPTGSPLGNAMRLTLSSGDARGPRIAWSSQVYGVTWGDTREGPNAIYFARFDASGNPIGSEVRVDAGNEPTIVWNGSGWAIAYQEGQAVKLARLTADGQALSSPVTVSDRPNNFNWPSLVWTGGGYGITWGEVGFFPGCSSCSKAVFALTDATGTRIGSSTVLSPDTCSASVWSLAWTGTEYGVAWDCNNPSEVYFTRVGASGTKLPGDTLVATQAADSFVAWNGAEYAFTWDSNAMRMARLAPDGTLLGDSRDLAAPGNSGYAMLWDGHAYGALLTNPSREALFLTVGCDCLDPDFDGISNCRPDNCPTSANASQADGDFDSVGDSCDNCAEVPNVSQADADADHSGTACDCNDADPAIHPGASETCNLLDDDCDAAVDEGFDADVDGRTSCSGDCDDTRSSIYPGAPQVCDGLNNDCSDPNWPAVPANEANGDGDGFRVCSGDCDDAEATVYPSAPQLCDGRNNDCLDPTWPTVSANEADSDGDGYRICQNDCNDSTPNVNPGRVEVCNSIDDNCNGPVDEDGAGVDSDADTVHNVCDNCRFAFNPDQLDTDSDAVGNSCDNCALTANVDQLDADADQRGNVCDNCLNAYNPLQDDFDGDRAGDACDNCVFDWNATQSDSNDDNQGDLCDLDDGLIYIYSTDRSYREWQAEAGFSTWNGYRGTLSVLKATGVYTQAPGSNPGAARDCGLTDPWVFDDFTPAMGDPVYWLTTGVAGGAESSLGTSSAGNPRPNTNPCP